jgi:hypothetical protein
MIEFGIDQKKIDKRGVSKDWLYFREFLSLVDVITLGWYL